jgi:hypothetical protein
MGHPLAPIRDLLRLSPAAADCLDRQGQSDALLEAVRALLDPEVRPHCLGAARSGEVLTLTLDSPAWATRVRYLARDLAGALAGTGPGRGVVLLKARVRPASAGSGPRAARLPRLDRRLTPEVVGHLLEAADRLGDEGLAEALRRLARRHAPGRRGPPD